MRFAVSLSLILILNVTISAESPKATVPDQESQESALRAVRELYKADYDKAKSASDKTALARKMLKDESETKGELATRFVLLRVARDVAAQQGDLTTACEAIGRIHDLIETDVSPMKLDAATTAARAWKTPMEHLTGLDQLLPLVDEFLTAEQYDSAKNISSLALACARVSQDSEMTKSVTAKVQEVAEIFSEYEKAKASAAILRKEPTDPNANSVWGKFRCFVRGDWDQGIPMLALGDDQALRKLASAELDKNVERLAAGDAWWEYAESLSGNQKTVVKSHAVTIYASVRSQLSGIAKTRVEKRIGSLPGISTNVITNSIGMRLKLLPAGKFTMGSANGNPDEAPPHEVTLTKPFYLGVHEVTQEQYASVMGKNPSNHEGANSPVERVSWDDAMEFCRRLSEAPREKAAGRVYRLPTEAEWEYACRAETTTNFHSGDNELEIGDYAWHDKNSGKTTHPVGQKQPNAWGLYDMHGNVCEWCSDWCGDYPQGAVTDPTGPPSLSHRVARGGDWFYNATRCRSAHRYRYDPSYRNDNCGFRVAMSSSRIPK